MFICTQVVSCIKISATLLRKKNPPAEVNHSLTDWIHMKEVFEAPHLKITCLKSVAL